MNPDLATTAELAGMHRLGHLGVLRFAGADASAFLQGQVSNDTLVLREPAPMLAAYSSAQGRVEAIVHCLPHSSGILAIMPREIVLPTAERLRRFVMRAKVKIEDLSEEFIVAGAHGPEALTEAGLDSLGQSSPAVTTPIRLASRYHEQTGIGVAAVAHDARRHWIVGPRADLETRLVEPAPPIALERAWRLADIRTGLPQVYAATREMFVAQMLNLDLIDGISFRKGCYTGQEIIARTQHLGRIKRRMFRLLLPNGTWTVGQSITLSDGRTGRITECVSVADGIEALAVLNTVVADGATAESASVAAHETPAAGSAALNARELPLPYALS